MRIKFLLRWAGRLSPYAGGVVFLAAAASKIGAFSDWAPYLACGEAEGIRYLGVLAVLIESPLGVFLMAVRESGVRAELESKLLNQMKEAALVICELDIFENERSGSKSGVGSCIFRVRGCGSSKEEEAVKQGFVDKAFSCRSIKRKRFDSCNKGCRRR